MGIEPFLKRAGGVTNVFDVITAIIWALILVNHMAYLFAWKRIVLNKKLLNFFIFIVDAQLYSFSISWLDMAIYDFFHMFFFIFTRAAILVSVEQFDDFGFILLVYLFMLGVHEFLNLVVYHRYGKIIID